MQKKISCYRACNSTFSSGVDSSIEALEASDGNLPRGGEAEEEE